MDNLSIDDIALDIQNVTDQLWSVIDSLAIVDNIAKLLHFEINIHFEKQEVIEARTSDHQLIEEFIAKLKK